VCCPIAAEYAALDAQTPAALAGSSATALGDDLESVVERIEPS